MSPSSKIILTILIIVLIVVLLFRLWNRIDKQQGNPYEYDLSALQQVDPKLLTYEEVRQLYIPGKRLRALAVDADDRLYVASDSTLSIYDQQWKLQFRFPLDTLINCLAVDDEQQIYAGVTDHLVVFNARGEKMKSWSKLNDDALITSVAVSATDVFVADASNKIVLRYDRSGQLLGQIGDKNSDRDFSGFIIPSRYFDVAIGYEGDLWAVNPGQHTLENYAADGRLRSSWGKGGMNIDSFCGCCNPIHLAIMSNGYFVTAEKGLPRVKVYDQMGRLREVVAAPQHFAEGSVIADLAVDSVGNIFVLDSVNQAVRIFERHRSLAIGR